MSAFERAMTVNGIYKKYNTGLRKYLERRLPSPEDVDVIVQEVYIRLIRHSKLDGLEPSLPLLCTIASNLIKDRIRKKGAGARYMHVPLDEVEIKSKMASPEEMVMSNEGIAKFKLFFKTLNKDCQRVFILHRLKGFTYEEISEKNEETE